MAERIAFDGSLYFPEAVEAAAAAYAEHARIEVIPEGSAVIAVISDVVEHDPQLIRHAFCNHVLHETISRRRDAAVHEGG